MRILFLTETVPYPLDSGGRIKTFHTLRMLADAHEVRLHAFIRDDAQRVHRGPLEALGVPTDAAPGAAVGGPARPGSPCAVWPGAPYSVGRHFDAAVFAAVAGRSRRWRPDLVYCDHLSMAEYARPPRPADRLRRAQRRVRDPAALRRDPARSAAPAPRAAVEWRRVRRYEAEVCRRSRLVFVVSDVDRQALTALAGAEVHFVEVPIAVDAAAHRADRDAHPRAAPAVPRRAALAAQRRRAGDVRPRHVAAGPRRPGPDATLTSVGRDDNARRPRSAAARRACT